MTIRGFAIKATTLLLVFGLRAAAGERDSTALIIRCDDIGMCHAVNEAALRVIETGLPVSFSVMFACPWYQEAVAILREHPAVSVGVHLTLNAEWKGYRWGPVSGAAAVPSLVDSCGYFFPSRALLFAHHPDSAEAERELRAQIERAVHSGLQIDYLDYHMSAAVSTPVMRSIVEKLAAEYGLGISRYFGEKDIEGYYAVPPQEKRDSLLLSLKKAARSPEPRLLVFHIGLQTPEMDALIDLNPFGLKEMSRHRQAELTALTSPEFRSVLQQEGFVPITYRQLIGGRGLQSMARPPEE